MTIKTPRQGPGRFQWQTGAWFGTVLGSTCWLLLTAGGMVGRAPLLAGIVLGGFLLPNLAGLFLWQHRDRVSPYVALQGVTGLIGVCGVGVLVAIQRAGQFPAFEPRLSASVASYGFLTMVLGLMGWFWVLERTAIRKRSGQC